jgi:hypothetical protein
MFPIIGSGSCDNFNFSNTPHIFQNKIIKNSAVGVLFGGHISLGIGSSHGWKPLGKPRKIDKSSGNIIRSIDGKKASSLYEEFFDKAISELDLTGFGMMSILYPLGIYIEGNKEYLLRNPIDFLSDGSIVCQGDIPEGSEIHIMIGNKDACVQAALDAAQEAQYNLFGKKANLILVIESMARLKLLGKKAIKEVESIRKIFGDAVPILGLYTNGEISPMQAGEVSPLLKPIEESQRSLFHTESIVVLAIH